MSEEYGYIFKIFEEENNMRFKKDDLQLFDVVEWRNGWLMIVSEFDGKRYFTGVKVDEYNAFGRYDDFLNTYSKSYEPVKVYRLNSAMGLRDFLYSGDLSGYKLIWEEKQEVELTMDEIAEKFGVKVENLKIKK